NFGYKILGKETVLCKDTPAFIGNRIGVTSMAKVFELSTELGLMLHEVDKLTGPALGRPKTGTFRLADLVGLDTALMVMTDLKERCPDDPEIQKLEFPSFLNYLTENKYLGNKSGQGFYKKTDEKDEKGRSVILELNLESNEYVKAPSSDLKSLQLSKQIDDLGRRIKALWEAEDKGAELVRKSLAFSFLYSAARIPEISDNIYSIDQAMKAGFAWPLGPFEYADVVGVDQMIETGKEMSMEIPEWIHEFQKTKSSFYKTESSRRYYYDLDSKTHVILPGTESQINIGYFKDQTPVLSNDEMTVHDIGDGVLALEFTSKSNTIGEGILRGI